MATDRNRMKCDRFYHTLRVLYLIDNKKEPYQMDENMTDMGNEQYT